MIKIQKKLVTVVGAAVIAVGFPLGTLSLVSAATPSMSKQVIPNSIMHTERLSAEASVLKTTTSDVQAAHKAKTMKQLVTSAGLTEKTYHKALKTQIDKDLEAKGYSATEIKATLHKEHHHHKQMAKKSN
jgi:hypothetical protein